MSKYDYMEASSHEKEFNKFKCKNNILFKIEND